MPSRIQYEKTMIESEEYQHLSDYLADNEWISDEVWKKIEWDKQEQTLTPPRSPSSRDKGQIDCLDDDLLTALQPLSCENFEVLHDCMWSGQCSQDCRKKDYRPRSRSISEECRQASPLAVCGRPTTPACFVNPKAAVITPVAGDFSGGMPCVSPATLYNYTPLSDHCYYQANQQQSQNDSERCRNTFQECSRKTVVLSDTPSDSDSEIDVVSCSSYKEEREQARTIESVASSRYRRALCCKRQFDSKLMSSSYSGSSSRSSSDSEDPEKRSQHNSMERKRRDDLRFAFQQLRDNVPDLRENGKAPKVLILSKAAAYVRHLTSTGKSLERTLRSENKRQQELQKRLRQLKQTSR